MIFVFVGSLWLFLLPLLLNGCVPASSSVRVDEKSVTNHPVRVEEKSVTNHPRTNNGPNTFASYSQETDDLERLNRLWQRRTQNGPIADYPIGPGDILEISVPGMEELKSHRVRVSGEGTISLPLLGVVQASGLTEKDLGEEIRRRLEESYMYNPQIKLFVREYSSRKAAIIGAVKRPGLYNLISGSTTILTMISLAGGMTEKAAPRIYLIPAEPIDNVKAKELAAILPAQVSLPLILNGVDPIVIDLMSLTKGGSQIYLNLPVWPGDVIMFPGNEKMLVNGWVARPGSYQITPGLTVLGAVTAAGGSLFPADTSAVRIIRTGKKGETTFIVADLDKIRLGEEPDILVQEGDIIDVSSSALKLVPYAFIRYFSNVFRVGATVNLLP